MLRGPQRVVVDVLVFAAEIHLQARVDVAGDVVVDGEIRGIIVEVDAGHAVAGAVGIGDGVIGDDGPLAVHADGIDAAGIGGLEAEVRDVVVEDFQAAGLVQNAVAAGVVDGVVIDLDVIRVDDDGCGIGGGIVDVVNDIVGDARPGPVHIHAIAGAVSNRAVFQHAVRAIEHKARVAGRRPAAGDIHKLADVLRAEVIQHRIFGFGIGVDGGGEDTDVLDRNVGNIGQIERIVAPFHFHIVGRWVVAAGRPEEELAAARIAIPFPGGIERIGGVGEIEGRAGIGRLVAAVGGITKCDLARRRTGHFAGLGVPLLPRVQVNRGADPEAGWLVEQ
jgi:hypothetical protein